MKLGVREFIFIAVLLGMLVCSYIFIFQKVNLQRNKLLSETKQQEQTLNDVRQATHGIDDLNRKIAQQQKAISFFQARLPAQREVDRILKEVWQIAEADRLTTKTIKTLKSEHNANYSEQPIEMSLAGDFTGFYSFLQQLETLDRITRVSQMNLQRIDGENGQMQAKLTLSVFFTPDSSAEASVR